MHFYFFCKLQLVIIFTIHTLLPGHVLPIDTAGSVTAFFFLAGPSANPAQTRFFALFLTYLNS